MGFSGETSGTLNLTHTHPCPEAHSTLHPLPPLEAAPAAVTGGQDVALVVGSFFMGDSKRDAEEIVSAFPESDMEAPVAAAGNEFDFNSLANTKFLVVCTSSMYGNPPKNFWEFYYHLKVSDGHDVDSNCQQHQ